MSHQRGQPHARRMPRIDNEAPNILVSDIHLQAEHSEEMQKIDDFV